MKSLIVDNFEALAQYAQAWNRLAVEAQPHGSLPMQGYAWVSSYLEHRIAADASWFCVMVMVDERLVGMAPLILHNNKRRVRGFDTLTTPRDDHTFGVNLLAAAGYEQQVMATVLRAAAQHDNRWRYLELNRVSSATEMWRFQGRQWRYPLTSSFYGTGAYLPTVGDFGHYRAGLSRNFRNNLNKAKNKLRKLPNVQFSFLCGDHAEPEQLKRFMSVEGGGWKGREGTAIATCPRLIRFYSTLVKRLAEAGWLQWHFLEADGELLAGNLAVQFGRSLLIWKLGYDERYRRCSPGSLLLEKLAERCFQDASIDEINLSTDQPWYNNWAMEKRRYFDARVHLWRPGSVLLSYLPTRTRQTLRTVPAARQLVGLLRSSG